MTVLEELIDTAYQLCEQHTSRDKDPMHAHTHRDSRAAVLLAADGRIFTGIDVYTPLVSSSSTNHMNNSMNNHLNTSMSAVRFKESAANSSTANFKQLTHSASNNTFEEKTSAEMVALLAAATENCSQFVVSYVVCS